MPTPPNKDFYHMAPGMTKKKGSRVGLIKYKGVKPTKTVRHVLGKDMGKGKIYARPAPAGGASLIPAKAGGTMTTTPKKKK